MSTVTTCAIKIMMARKPRCPTKYTPNERFGYENRGIPRFMPPNKEKLPGRSSPSIRNTRSQLLPLLSRPLAPPFLVGQLGIRAKIGNRRCTFTPSAYRRSPLRGSIELFLRSRHLPLHLVAFPLIGCKKASKGPAQSIMPMLDDRAQLRKKQKSPLLRALEFEWRDVRDLNSRPPT